MNSRELNEKISSLVESSLENFYAGNYEDSIRDLKAAESIDRNNPEILYNLGVSYSRLGLHKTAIIYFKRIVDLPLTFVDIQSVRKLMAYSYINLKEYDLAEECLEEVIKHSPEDTGAHGMMGYSLEKKMDYSSAVNVYKMILDIDKKNINACNSLACILAGRNVSLDKALKFAKIALKSSPENPSYLDTMGYVLMKQGDLNNAESFFKKAVKKKPLCAEIKSHIDELERLKKRT